MVTVDEIQKRLDAENGETSPSLMPTRKITAVALTGALVAAGVAVAGAFGVVLPVELVASLTAVLTPVVGWFVSDAN